MTSRHKAFIYLLVAMVIWGVASPVIKFTLQGIDPLPFLAYRFLISGAISLVIIFMFRLKVKLRFRDISLLVVYGLLSTTLALGFLFLGLDRTTVLELGLIGAISPLVVTIGGYIFLREHVTHKEKVGIAIAFVGTLFTVFAPVLLGDGQIKFSGNILLMLYLISDSASILLAKSMLKHRFAPLTLSMYAFVVGAATLIPVAVSAYGFQEIVSVVSSLDLQYHLGVWYMAVASGSLAYFLFVKGERSVEAGEASLFFYLGPIFSVPLAVFWLGETITATFVMGAIIIATGVYIAEKRKG